MLTKVKRVKRKKYAIGDEARKFENIPTASQPVQDTGLGTRNQLVDKFSFLLQEIPLDNLTCELSALN